MRQEILRGLLARTPTWVFHNAKFDLQKLDLIGVLPEFWETKSIHDTQLIYHLMDENGRKGLKHLAVHVLKVDDTIPVEIKSGPRKGEVRRVPREQHELRKIRQKLQMKASEGYHALPRWVVVPYATKDTEFTLLLYEKLWPQFERLCEKSPELMELYHNERRLTLALLDMEAKGFGVDTKYLDSMVHEYGQRVMEKLMDVVDRSGNDQLNPASPKQLIEAFARLGATVDGTAVAALQELMHKTSNEEVRAFAQAVIDFRADTKVYTTYLKALQDEQRGGVCHPNFNAVQARTGRMSSSTASNR